MRGEEDGGQGKLVPASTRSLSNPSSALAMRGLKFLAEKQIDYAYTLIGKGDEAGAVLQLREALNLTPRDTGARSIFAALLHGMGDIRGAIAEYREVLRIGSDDDEVVQRAHMGLGAALMGAGDFSAAIPEFREVIRLGPDCVSPRLRRAYYASAYIWLGTALEKSGDLQGAVAEYQEAVRVNPGDITSHLELGQALRATGQRDSVCIEFYRVLYMAKDNLFLYEEVAEIARNALRDMGEGAEIS